MLFQGAGAAAGRAKDASPHMDTSVLAAAVAAVNTWSFAAREAAQFEPCRRFRGEPDWKLVLAFTPRSQQSAHEVGRPRAGAASSSSTTFTTTISHHHHNNCLRHGLSARPPDRYVLHPKSYAIPTKSENSTFYPSLLSFPSFIVSASPSHHLPLTPPSVNPAHPQPQRPEAALRRRREQRPPRRQHPDPLRDRRAHMEGPRLRRLLARCRVVRTACQRPPRLGRDHIPLHQHHPPHDPRCTRHIPH